MNFDGLTAEGDLPPNHPLVLEALKGIISGPISEFKTTVDNLITNPSNALKRTEMDYQNILPVANKKTPPSVDLNLQISNDIINQFQHNHQAPVIPIQQVPITQQPTPEQTVVNDPNQMELPLFKPTEISDLYKKLFDIEEKLDRLIKYVKRAENKK